VKVTRGPGYEACLAEAQKIGPIVSSRKIYDLLHPYLDREDQEVFLVVLCDVRGTLRGVAEVARGQRSSVHVGIGDVMRVVDEMGAEMFAVVHNHPSGNPHPSQADRELTTTIKKAAAVRGSEVTFVDHVVLGTGSFFSIAENKKYAA
jgi:DNA repair protein RadC